MKTVQTQKPERRNGRYCRFIKENSPEFSDVHFSDEWLNSNGAVVGTAAGGRDTASFLNIDGSELVLRRFRRGGLAQRISRTSYLWTGLERTRAFAEFNCLLALQEKSLPAPAPYACEVVRKSFTYQASLITYRLPGHTWASSIATGEDFSSEQLLCIGNCIARFHKAGVCHADLNAHNILLSPQSSEPVFLIDFDKAEMNLPLNGEWRQKNLNRLRRSLVKEYGKIQAQLPVHDWTRVMEGYERVRY